MPTRPVSESESPYEIQLSWTDDLEACKQSGVGYSTNQIYTQVPGPRPKEHSFEDAFINCHYSNNISLYGVFDGHNGDQTAKFALQTLASEILHDRISKISNVINDKEIHENLRQAFNAVERNYLQSIDRTLAERASLLDEIPSGMKIYDAYKSHPHLVDNLNSLNKKLSCGTTAVIALIINNRLFVANVGDSRALLCKKDENGVLRVIQLSVNHDLSNEDELLRLYNLGLRFDRVSKGYRLGNQKNTRCLGNYLVKGGYKEFEELAAATSDPIIYEPEIHGGVDLDNICGFLLLMTDGLCKSLEAFGKDTDKIIAHMVDQEFKVQSTLTGVAQAVVDKVVRKHHDMYMQKDAECAQGSRDDITLLVRNFDYDFPNAVSSPLPPPTVIYEEDVMSGAPSSRSESSISEPATTLGTLSNSTNNQIPKTDTIKPYVDFSEYFINVERAKLEGTLPDGLEL